MPVLNLKDDELFDKRDLMPTSNSFSWFANVLAQHWQLNKQELEHVFPNIKPYNKKLLRS